jgi:hypothetical protein
MNLEILNRSSTVVKEKAQQLKSVATFKIENDKTFTFSAQAARLFEMSKGKYVHFGREGAYWYFIVNEVNTGFPISWINSKEPMKNGCRIGSFAMVRLFMQSTKRKIGDTFYVQITKSTHNGDPVIEILTNKTVKEIAANN